MRSRNVWMWVAAVLTAASMVTACGNKKEAAGGAAKADAAAAQKGEPAGEADAAEKAPEPKKGEAPEEARGEPTTVVLWHAYRGKEKEALLKAVEAFNTSQQQVRLEAQAVPYDPFVDKITITVPQGQGPDLFIFAHNMIGNWVDKDILVPLGGKVPSEALQQFTPWSVKALVYRKNLYGLPLAFKSLVLFTNKKLLPEAPATMEELVGQLKKVATGDVRGLVYEAGGLYFHAPWIHAFGGRIFDDAHQPAFDTEAQKNALEYVRSLHMEHGVLPKGLSGAVVTDLFNKGQAAAVLNGPWFRTEIAEDIDYGVSMIPTVEGKRPKPFLGIEAVFVASSSKHKDAAVKAALFLAGPESAKVRMAEGKQPVTHQATLAAGAEEDPVMRVFMEQAEHAELMDASPEMQLVWTHADSAIASGVFVESAKPGEELAKAQKKIAAEIEKRGK